jgi:hypothetical protein
MEGAAERPVGELKWREKKCYNEKEVAHFAE